MRCGESGGREGDLISDVKGRKSPVGIEAGFGFSLRIDGSFSGDFELLSPGVHEFPSFAIHGFDCKRSYERVVQVRFRVFTIQQFKWGVPGGAVHVVKCEYTRLLPGVPAR